MHYSARQFLSQNIHPSSAVNFCKWFDSYLLYFVDSVERVATVIRVSILLLIMKQQNKCWHKIHVCPFVWVWLELSSSSGRNTFFSATFFFSFLFFFFFSNIYEVIKFYKCCRRENKNYLGQEKMVNYLLISFPSLSGFFPVVLCLTPLNDPWFGWQLFLQLKTDSYTGLSILHH